MKKELIPALLMACGMLLHAAEISYHLNAEDELRTFSRHKANWDLTGGVNGSGCLKFYNKEPNGYPQTVELDKDLFKGKKIVLSAMVKALDLKTPANKYWGPKVCLYYKTKSGKQNFIECPKSYGTYDWKPVSVTAKIPADVETLNLLAGVQRCAGTFMIDEISIREAGAEKGYENHVVTGWTDHENAIYKPGEPMHFYFRVLDGKKSVSGKVRVVIGADDGRKQTYDTAVSEKEPLHIATSLAVPGFVMIRVQLLDREGKVVSRKNPNGAMRVIQWGLAAGVEPEKLVQGKPEPADFDAFWEKQKKELAAVPLKVLEKKLVRSTAEYDVYDMKISCVGDRPVSGYLTMPKNAKPKSLSLDLRFDGYSVQGATMIPSRHSITFFVNPHGIENGRERAYYDALRRGELAGYGFRNNENKKPETVYFRNMLLRNYRAAEYLKQLPEWNGKDFYISGGSQGAFQAVAACGLIRDVTKCNLGVPWFCDLGGIEKRRVRGWRPDWQDGLGYYDTVNFAKRIKCPVNIDAGLSDWVCPPSGVWVLYNNLKVPVKTMTMRQGYDHAVYHGYDRAKAPCHFVRN